MSAGSLDRRVTIRRGTVSNTGLGVTTTWLDYGTFWASRKDVSDAERAAAGSVQGTVVSRFVVRWSADTAGIKPADRLVEGGMTFEVRGIKEVGRRRYIEITAEARLD